MFLLLYGSIEWGLEISVFIFGVLALILLAILISGFKSLIDTVAISSKGIKYSTILKKIYCDWKDIFRIEVVTHKSRSEQTGLVVSSTIEYIIFTSKGNFSLKEGSNWGWDTLILREIVYDMIKPYAQDAEIIQREEKSILHDIGKYQTVVISEIFNKLDHRIWDILRHWAKRRHPTKSNKWIANKYWHSDGKREWIFSEGTKQLKSLSNTKIVRHTKLKLDMNPYLDRDYFVLRKLKLRARKVTAMAKNVLDKAKICKPEIKTMTNSCCLI